MLGQDILSANQNYFDIGVAVEELERRRETYGISYIAVLDDGENNMVETFAPVVKRLAGK